MKNLVEQGVSFDAIVSHVRHGEAVYQPGEEEGTLTIEGTQQIFESAKRIAQTINPSHEVVILWTSFRRRALQATEIIETILLDHGIEPIQISTKQSLGHVTSKEEDEPSIRRKMRVIEYIDRIARKVKPEENKIPHIIMVG